MTSNILIHYKDWVPDQVGNDGGARAGFPVSSTGRLIKHGMTKGGGLNDRVEIDPGLSPG